MSYQDDNTWQILTDALCEKYHKEAKAQLESDFKKLVKYSSDNNIKVPVFNPKYDIDYNQTVYYLARENWERDGYKESPTGFTHISEREREHFKKILDDVSGEMNEL